MTTPQRRAHSRYQIRLGVHVQTDSGVIRGATHDVSAGGCRVESTRPLPEGATVGLELIVVVDDVRDADYPPLRTHGSVRWISEGESAGEQVYYAGLEFQGVTPEQATWLQQVIARSQS